MVGHEVKIVGHWAKTLALGLACFFLIQAAYAEVSQNASESLFQEGRRLLEREEYAEACRVLSASLEMERALGTLLNLARCRELEGRTATAWSLFAEAEAQARRLNDLVREEVARENKLRLDPLVHRLRLHLVAAEEGAQLFLDGQPIPLASAGHPLAIDPGEHVVELRAAGKIAVTHRFETTDATSNGSRVLELQLGPLQDLPPPVAPTPTPLLRLEQGETTNSESRLPEPEPASTSSKRGLLVPGLAVVGTVLVGVGSALVIDALVRAGNAECDEDLVCSPEGHDDRVQAKKMLGWGYAVGALGLATLGTGVVLHLRVKSRSKNQASAPSGLEVALQGNF
jgi:hypothetical protein